MEFDLALRLTEILVSLAVIQRGLEHLVTGDAQLFIPQILCAGLLLVGGWPAGALVGLWVLGLVQLHRFQGPYNGGADKMVLLTLTCLTLGHMAPPFWAEMALSYLAVQLVLSYAVSGWVKAVNPDWREGRALADVFRITAYPVSEALRGLGASRRLMRLGSWGVIGFELAFPLALTHPALLAGALCVAATFHTANACLFGLNRFLWAWLAAFPSLIWFQDRLLG